MSNHLKVGIDIEKIDERVIKVDRKFLNQYEINWLSTLDLDSRIKFTTLCWSIKESVFKWWGAGGVDFSSHINIHDPGQFDQGTISVDFTTVSFKSLQVHCSLIGDHWLTYIASE
jgi:phosphopantetheinyl transferase